VIQHSGQCPYRYAAGVALRDKASSCEICRTPNVEPLPSYVSSAMCPECPRKDWGPAELSKISVDREVIRVLLGLLST